MSGLTIVPPSKSATLGKQQVRFNKLVKQVSTLKAALAAWADLLPTIHRQISAMQPNQQVWDDVRAELAILFDQHHASKILSQQDRRELSDWICELAQDVLRGGGHPALKSIYARHSGSNFDREQEQEDAVQIAFLRRMVEHELGIDLQNEKIESPEDFQRILDAHMGEQAQRPAPKPKPEPERAHPRRGKAAKQASRPEVEAMSASKTLQLVYRQLAKALHPDHEPEPAERARKTALMQELNAAYERKDLLALLELQLRFEQLDRTTIDSLAEERLAHFNRLLAAQVEHLQTEIADVEMPWRMQLEHRGPRRKATPKIVLAAIAGDARKLADAIVEIRRDLEVFADPRMIKAELHSARRSARQQARDDW